MISYNPIYTMLHEKGKVCCFSGHRQLSKKEIIALLPVLQQMILRMIRAADYRVFIAGGALGFDMLVAEMILHLRQTYPDIFLYIAAPYPGQEKGWKAEEIMRYTQIMKETNYFSWISPAYSSGCMYLRNRFMVDNSDALICYQTRNSGGTAYTVRYAKSKQHEIFNLANYIHSIEYTEKEVAKDEY